jgi:hypothetical protein
MPGAVDQSPESSSIETIVPGSAYKFVTGTERCNWKICARRVPCFRASRVSSSIDPIVNATSHFISVARPAHLNILGSTIDWQIEAG